MLCIHTFHWVFEHVHALHNTAKGEICLCNFHVLILMSVIYHILLVHLVEEEKSFLYALFPVTKQTNSIVSIVSACIYVCTYLL